MNGPKEKGRAQSRPSSDNNPVSHADDPTASQYITLARRRRRESWRIVPLESGHADPWRYAPPSAGYSQAVAHVLAAGDASAEPRGPAPYVASRRLLPACRHVGGRALGADRMSTDVDRGDELREMYADEADDPLAGMFSGAWLDTHVFPPLEYAVPGIIPEGFGLLVSPPKAAKSWLVCGIGLACATGGLALGAIHVRKRPVLYLALEDGQRRLQSRSRRIMCGEPLPAGIHFVTKAKPAEVIPMIAEFLQRHTGDKPLIILDTLGKARSARPPGADLYAWDYEMGSKLKDTIDSVPGASLLVVHHTRKAESSDFVDSVSGSQGIAGSADFVLVLSRKRHSDEALLSVTGRDIAEGEYALKTDDGIWQLDGTNLATASVTAERRRFSDTHSDRSVEIVAIVAASPKPVSPTEVSEKLDIHNDTVGRYLRRLADKGLIRRSGRGLYIRGSEVSECPNTTPSDTTDASDTGLWAIDTRDGNDQSLATHCGCGKQLLAPVSKASGICRTCAKEQEAPSEG
jgi:AAA domain